MVMQKKHAKTLKTCRLVLMRGWINGCYIAGSNHGSAAKGSAADLEVAGFGPVGCCPFSFLFSIRTMCSSLTCLSCLRYIIIMHIVDSRK